MWIGWIRCLVMCGGVNVIRMRLCNVFVFSNGGRFCNGFFMDLMICGNSICFGNKLIIIFFFYIKENMFFFFLMICFKDLWEISIVYDVIILFFRNFIWI